MHILIVKTSSLGDILQSFPVLDFLKTYWEPLTIDWVVEASCRGLIERHPLVDHAIPFDSYTWRKKFYTWGAWKEFSRFVRCLQRNEYDVVFDLQGNLKSAFITYFARSRHKVGFGKQSVAEWPNLWVTRHQFDPPEDGNIRDDYLYLVKEFFQDDRVLPPQTVSLRLNPQEEKKKKQLLERYEQKKPLFLICPGSRWPNKMISEKTLVPFLHYLHKEYAAFFLFLWGSEQEKQQANHLHHIFPRVSEPLEKLSLALLQNFLKEAVDVIVSMDSLPLHLGETAQVPTFSIFGPSSAIKYAPEGNLHSHIQGDCPYGKTFVKRCPVLRTCPTGLCIKGIDSATLFERFKSWYQLLPNMKKSVAEPASEDLLKI